MTKRDKSVFPARHRLSTGTVLMVSLSLGAGQALAQPVVRTPANHAPMMEQNTVHHFGWDDPHVAHVVEQNGQALVDVLERADQSLAAPDQETAMAANDLSYADDIAKGIELQMPYVLMKDRLETAKGQLEAGATHEFFQDLAPVYASIDDLTMLSPELAGQVKNSVKQAENLARSGARDDAIKQVDKVVGDVVASRIDMPIRYVRQQLGIARKALDRDDIGAARKGVEKALGSMIYVVTGDISAVEAGIIPPGQGQS